MTHATSANDLNSTLTGNYELYDDLSRLPSTNESSPISHNSARWRLLAEDRIRRNSTGTFSSSGQSPSTQSSPLQRLESDRTASELSTVGRLPFHTHQADFRYRSSGVSLAAVPPRTLTNSKQPTVTLKKSNLDSCNVQRWIFWIIYIICQRNEFNYFTVVIIKSGIV